MEEGNLGAKTGKGFFSQLEANIINAFFLRNFNGKRFVARDSPLGVDNDCAGCLPVKLSSTAADQLHIQSGLGPITDACPMGLDGKLELFARLEDKRRTVKLHS